MRAIFQTPRKYLGTLQARTGHQALPHSRCHRARGQTESRRQGHHRTGRGRTGFRHAAAHQGRGDRRDQQGLHQVHRSGRHAVAESRGDREVQARQRAGLHREADPGLMRRQAEFLQPRAGGDQSRRRGDHSRALLGVVSGHRADRGRQAGDRAGGHRAGFQDDARATGSGDHAQDQDGGDQQPEQSFRRGVHAGRPARRWARCCASIRRC